MAAGRQSNVHHLDEQWRDLGTATGRLFGRGFRHTRVGRQMQSNSTQRGREQQLDELQTILSAEEDGGVAKLNVARVTVTASGDWLLPFWREASGPSLGKCWGDAGISFHGIPGVFKSSDQVHCFSAHCILPGMSSHPSRCLSLIP